MAINIYLSVPNIPGESTATGYKNLFQLQTVTWGGSTPISPPGGVGKAAFTSVSITKLSLSHGPSLMLAMATGKNLGAVVITTTNVLANSEVAINVITLTNAVLNSYSQSLEAGGIPTETLTFAFSKVEFVQNYYGPNGALQNKDDHTWDISGNKGA